MKDFLKVSLWFFSIIAPLILYVLFAGAIIAVIAVIIQGMLRWRHNNHQPLNTRRAKLIGKRTYDVRGFYSDGSQGEGYTLFFLTFELEAGDRLEFQVKRSEFEGLEAGDVGALTFQGEKFHGFQKDQLLG